MGAVGDDIECSCGEPGRVAPDGWTERHRTDGPCYVREHDERFMAVWEAIKRWDISTPADQGLYSGATGDEVCEILEAIDEVETDINLGLRRELAELRREVGDLRNYIRMSAINGLRMVGLTEQEDDRGR